MTDREWQKFFALVGRIVNEGRPWKDKRDELLRRAGDNDARVELEELMSWDWESLE